jgi:hypothetical protein
MALADFARQGVDVARGDVTCAKSARRPFLPETIKQARRRGANPLPASAIQRLAAARRFMITLIEPRNYAS